MHTLATGTAKAYQGYIEVDACGRRWTLQRPADLETLWDNMSAEEFTEDERLPYWVELWPASLALATLLEKNQERIQHAPCLDLGCGLGFTALVGSWLGARVIGIDYEKDALLYAKKNADINQVAQPLWTVMDWRFPAVLPQKASYIWAGDIVYENRFIEPVLHFLEYALAKGGVVWLAEPGRNVYAAFKAALIENGWESTRVSTQKVEPLHVQKNDISVNLWELTRR